MSTEQNKRIVRQFHEAMVAEDYATVLAYLAPDATWWLPGEAVGGSSKTKQEIALTIGVFANMFRREPETTLISLTAEDDRVVLEKSVRSGETHGGTFYGNDYLMLFRLRDGEIMEVREYMNPKLAEPLLAELAANAAAN